MDFGGSCGVGDFGVSFVEPGDGGGEEFVEPFDLALFQVAMEGVEEGGGLGFFDEGEAFESAGETGGDGGFVERGEFEFGHGCVEEVDAGDEFFDAVVEEGEVEASGLMGFGEGAGAVAGIEVVLLGFLFDDEVVEADELHGSDAFVFLVEDVLDGGAEMLGEHFGDPLGLDGGGEAEEGEAGGDLMEVGDDEIRLILHYAFADEFSFSVFGEVTGFFSGFAAFGELVDEAGHEAAEEGFFVFCGRCFFVVEFLLMGGVEDLLVGLINLAGDLGVDAAAAAGGEVEAV